jgi:adenosylcobinamide-phosphate synthase
MNFLVIVLALLIDQILGEPKRYHPLVGFGLIASILETKTNNQSSNTLSFIGGGIALIILIFVPILLVVLASYLLSSYAFILDIIILYWAVGMHSLVDHTRPIITALQNNDLVAAKEAVSSIVSRNTEKMDHTQVATATIESTLENGCDGVFGALFWCLAGGAPLVVAYRLVNTLDAMWGYRTKRFEYFGKPAAILDDILNYIPARLTALAYALIGNTKAALRCWQEQSSQLASPNGGPVMCAGAGSLNIKLGGPTVYHNKLVDKPFFGGDYPAKVADITRANTLIFKTTLLWCSVVLVLDLMVTIL